MSDPAMPNPLLDAALLYASRHWPVCPLHVPRTAGLPCTCGRRGCSSPGKHPRTQHGLKDASIDPAVIRAWWAKWPDSNIAIVTGHGIFALDVDDRKGGSETLAELERTHGKLPDTIESLTGGGGRHILFRAPIDPESAAPVRVPNSAELIGPGLDIRGDGGYIVAPPSLHASGRTYAWEACSDPTADASLAFTPEWLLAAAIRRRPGLRIVGTPAPAVVCEGKRNEELFRLACSLRAKELDEIEIEAALLTINQRRCTPPLDEAEVRNIAKSAARKPAGRSPGYTPRGLPGPAPVREPGVDDGDPASAPATESHEPVHASADDWTADLARKPNGDIKNTFGNLCSILRGDERYAGKLRFNRMSLQPELDTRIVTDPLAGRIREEIEAQWLIAPSAENLGQALLTVSDERSYHPVQQYLEALAWDGRSRIESIAETVLHVPVTVLTQQIIRAWFTGAVARAMVPGCKVDTALVLFGPQGWLKSTFFRVLGHPWFSDSSIDIANKDAYLQLHDSWLYEWPEIEAITTQRHAGTVKAFVSSQCDLFRAPYARTTARVPRTNVIVGSTNEQQFLEDPTGSRRFWVLAIREPVSIAPLERDRDQLWAEAIVGFRAGRPWWLEPKADSEREEIAEEHRVRDPYEESIAAWLEHRKTDVNYDPSFPITTRLILGGALRLEPGQRFRAHEMRVGAVMRRLGFSHLRLRVKPEHRSAIGTDLAWVWERPEAS